MSILLEVLCIMLGIIYGMDLYTAVESIIQTQHFTDYFIRRYEPHAVIPAGTMQLHFFHLYDDKCKLQHLQSMQILFLSNSSALRY